MNRLQPFQGWRFNPGRVDLAAVVAPPPGVITADNVASLYSRSPLNVAHLVPGRDSGHDTPTCNSLTRAAAHLDSWREQGFLLQDRQALYLYEREFTSNGKRIAWRGFICRLLLPGQENRDSGILNLPDGMNAAPAALARLRALRGYFAPLQGFIQDPQSEIASTIEAASHYEPLAEFVFDWGGLHRIRVLDHQERMHEILTAADNASVRMTCKDDEVMAAVTYRNQVRQAMQDAGRQPPELGILACDWLMVWLVPAMEFSPEPRKPAADESCGALAGVVFDLFW